MQDLLYVQLCSSGHRKSEDHIDYHNKLENYASASDINKGI